MKPLDEQVVVITGASSGVGRCAALHLADSGARVALFARDARALDELAALIRRRGGEAIPVAGDVSVPDDVERLADAAMERWGRIDSWVNGAAVFIQGEALDITPAEYRRVLEVDLLGVILGTRAALARMQGRGGVIVQVSSLLGERGAALFTAYSAAKRGVVGFTQSLRAELWGTGIRASLLYLPAMDTPIYRHARAKLGTVPKPAPPVYDPARGAQAIARLCVTGAPVHHVGLFHWLYTAPDRVSPRLGDWFLSRASGFTRTDLPAGEDNLDAPVTGSRTVRDGWGGTGWKGFTAGEMLRVAPGLTVAGAAAVLAGAAGAGLLLARALRR